MNAIKCFESVDERERSCFNMQTYARPVETFAAVYSQNN